MGKIFKIFQYEYNKNLGYKILTRTNNIITHLEATYIFHLLTDFL